MAKILPYAYGQYPKKEDIWYIDWPVTVCSFVALVGMLCAIVSWFLQEWICLYVSIGTIVLAGIIGGYIDSLYVPYEYFTFCNTYLPEERLKIYDKAENAGVPLTKQEKWDYESILQDQIIDGSFFQTEEWKRYMEINKKLDIGPGNLTYERRRNDIRNNK